MDKLTDHPLKTVLHEDHLKLDGKMVNFGGFDMPLYYTSIQEEHLAVREEVGLFDVSHMGLIDISGPQATEYLEFLCTNNVADKKSMSCLYTLFCQEDGGAVDDAIVYKIDDHKFFTIVNASNRDKDLMHMLKVAQNFDVKIGERFDDVAILALQGPKYADCLSKDFQSVAEMTPFTFKILPFLDESMIVAKTGYTGEVGIEIIVPNKYASGLFRQLLKNGAKACGLGARDTLRLEKGYALYGHEISETILPIESVCRFAVKMNKPNFLGKTFLQKRIADNNLREIIGIKWFDKGPIPRQGFKVFKEDVCVGEVTSGGFSPSLKVPIALVLVHHKLALKDCVDVEIRGKKVKAEVVKLSFI